MFYRISIFILSFNRIHLFIYLFLFSIFTNAQDVLILGKITDVNKTPINNAHVVILNNSGVLIDGSVSNSDGKFNFKINQNQEYKIEISHVGFENYNKVLHTSESSDIYLNIVLQEEKSQLSEIVISVKKPIRENGDTLTYNAKAFSIGNERKLEDVLEKLPGVTVNEDGLKFNGKEISKIMIEGRDFYGHDTNMATKNIPSSVIDNIEVIKNYNESTLFKNFDTDSDQIVINLKLKKEKEKFWFGNITSAYGTSNKYNINPNIFFYSKKNRVNSIVKLNNIGEVTFTIRDYLKYSGEYFELMNSIDPYQEVSKRLGFSLLENNKAFEINSTFSSLNVSSDIFKKSNFDGIILFNKSVSKFDFLTNEENNHNFQDYSKSEKQNEKNTNLIVNSKLYGDIKQNIQYKLFNSFKSINNSVAKNIDENFMKEFFNKSTHYIENENILDIKYKINEKMGLISNTSYNFYKTKSELDINSYREMFESIFATDLDDNNRFLINQNVNGNSQLFNTKFIFKRSIFKKTYMGVGVYYSYASQKFESIINIFDNPTDLLNQNQLYTRDYITNLSLNTKFRKMTLNIDFQYHNYNYSINSYKKHITYLEPRLSFKYERKSTNITNLTYEISKQNLEIDDYNTNYILEDLKRMNKNASILVSPLYHSIKLTYNNFNLFNFTTYMVQISYNKILNPIIHSIEKIEESGDINTISINSLVSTNALTGGVRFEKRSRNLIFSEFLYFKSNNLINHILWNSEYRNFRKTNIKTTTSIKTNRKDKSNYELGLKFDINKIYIDNKIDFIKINPFFNSNLKINKESKIVVSYSHVFYNKLINDSYPILTESFSYKFKKYPLEIGFYNSILFKQTKTPILTFNDFYTRYETYIPKPNYMWLQINYRF